MAKTSFTPAGRKVSALTIQMDKALSIDLYQCDEDFKEMGIPEKFIMVDQSEEEFHTKLRIEANEKGHYVPEYSTNHEWNPK